MTSSKRIGPCYIIYCLDERDLSFLSPTPTSVSPPLSRSIHTQYEPAKSPHSTRRWYRRDGIVSINTQFSQIVEAHFLAQHDHLRHARARRRCVHLCLCPRTRFPRRQQRTAESALCKGIEGHQHPARHVLLAARGHACMRSHFSET